MASSLKVRASKIDLHVAELEKRAVGASKAGNRILANHLLQQAEKLAKHSSSLSARDRMENPPKEPVLQERKRFKPSALGAGQADAQPASRTDRVPQRPQQPVSARPEKAWSDEARAAALAARQAGHVPSRGRTTGKLNQFNYGLNHIATQVGRTSSGSPLFHLWTRPEASVAANEIRNFSKLGGTFTATGESGTMEAHHSAGGIKPSGKEVTDMATKGKADDYARLGRGGRSVTMGGKVRGRHGSRAEAVAQVQAINLSKLRAEGRPGIPAAPKKGWTTLPDGRRIMIADDKSPSPDNPLVIGGRNPWMIGGQHVGMGGTDRNAEVHAAGPRGAVKPGAGPMPGEMARNVPPSAAAAQMDQRQQAARGLQRKYIAPGLLDERKRDLGPETSRGIARLTDDYKPETGSMRASNRPKDTQFKYKPSSDMLNERRRNQVSETERGVDRVSQMADKRIDARQVSLDNNDINRASIQKEIWDGITTKEEA